MPVWQVATAGHGLSHVPQWSLLVSTAVHVPSHSSLGASQLLPPAPPPPLEVVVVVVVVLLVVVVVVLLVVVVVVPPP